MTALTVFDLRAKREKTGNAKRVYRRRVCSFPGCTSVVRRLHNHLQGKHHLNRHHPQYAHYLRSATFEEISSENVRDDEDVSSSSQSEIDEEVQSATTSAEASSEEHSEDSDDSPGSHQPQTRTLAMKERSDIAKAIMRGGAKRDAPESTSEDDSEEDIPPTPAKVRLFSRLFQDKETAAPLPPRCRELCGEQDYAVLWQESSRAPITAPQHHGASGSDEPGSKDQNDEETEESTDTADANEATEVLLPTTKEFSREKEPPASCDSSSDVSVTVHRHEPEGQLANCEANSSDGSYQPSSHQSESDDEYETDSEGCTDDDNSDNGDAAHGNATTETILKTFQTWLQGIDGGRREVRTAKQYASQIYAIISAVDPVHLDAASIMDKKILRDKWLSELEKKRKPGTCKAYLGALAKFLRFLIVEKPDKMVLCAETVGEIREQVTEWMCSYKAPLAERRWEKQVEDLQKLVTPEAIQTFDKSQHARNAIKALGQCMERAITVEAPSQTEYCAVRDYLLTSICINNACRAGPLSSMTLGDLRKAKVEDGQVVVTVFKHKTLKAHGPATVVLNPTIHKWLMVFVSHMRHRLYGVSAHDHDALFVSWTAKSMSSSMISAQLNSCWQKAVGKDADRVSATAFRKAAVSVVHEQHGHLKNSLAALMDHNPKTAEKYYSIKQKSKNAARTAQALNSILHAPVLRSAEEKDQAERNNNEEEEEETETAGIHPKRHSWTQVEEAAVSSLFQSTIKAGNIDISMVKEKIREDQVLQKIPAIKVYDKVRYLIRTSKLQAQREGSVVEPPKESETIEQRVHRLFPEESTSADSVALLSSVSMKGGSAFSDEQTAIYWRLFKDLIESNRLINRAEICGRIQEDPEAREKIVGFTPQQLCSKIRTERKKIKRMAVKKEVTGQY